MVVATATPYDAVNALPVGHRLHEFELRGVIGVGGFGIVYRAFDHSLQRDVAIKEYMPAALAGRSGKQQVSLLSQAHAETFAVGLSSFVNEARLLARFDHPSLVKVHRFWEDNGTAYMVMPLYRGRTLRELRQSMQHTPDDAWLRRLLEPLLGALEVMHREAVYHRDIAPDNILVSDDSGPVLLDFGAARRVISDRSQALTAILKPSYAPIEQYAESTGLRQGPWTDFYALGATLHFLITGRPPLPATARTVTDDQPRLAGSGQGGLSDTLLQVCDWMIAPKPSERPQNVAEIRAALAGRLDVPRRATPATEISWQNTQVDPPAPAALPDVERPTRVTAARASRRHAWRWGAGIALGAASAALTLTWWPRADRAEAAVVSAARADAATPAAPERVPPPPDAARSASIDNTGASSTGAATATSGAEPVPAPNSASPAVAAETVRTPITRATADVPPPRRAPPRDDAARRVRPPPGAAPIDVAPPPTAVATAPAAVAPAPVVPVPVGSPRDQCSGRHLIALHRCMVRECEKPAFQDHPQCQKVRAIEERTRRTINAS